MPTSDHNFPTIATPARERNTYSTETRTVGKVWAGRTDISSYTADELHRAHAILLTSTQALRPFYSPERTAYLKLNAELHRRGL